VPGTETLSAPCTRWHLTSLSCQAERRPRHVNCHTSNSAQARPHDCFNVTIVNDSSTMTQMPTYQYIKARPLSRINTSPSFLLFTAPLSCALTTIKAAYTIIVHLLFINGTSAITTGAASLLDCPRVKS